MSKCLLAIAAGLFLFGMTTPAAAQRGCEAWGTPTAPGTYGPKIKTPGANAVTIQKATSQIRCKDKIHPVLIGWISVPDGRVLVPASYQSAIMLSPTRALVSRVPAAGQPLKWMIYEVGKGEVAAAPAFKTVSMLETGIAHFVKEGETYSAVGRLARPDGRYDLYIYPPGSSEPKIFDGAGGAGVEIVVGRHDGVLYANFADDKGGVVSRLIDLNGDPISPIVGRIESWTTVSPGIFNVTSNESKDLVSRELLTLVTDQKNPDLPSANLYLPLGYDGLPKALPKGVVGVFPLLAEVDFNDMTRAPLYSQYRAKGWGVVSSTPKGMAITYGNGSLNGVLAEVGKTPTATAMKRQRMGQSTLSQDLYLIRYASDGRWRPHWAGHMTPVDWPGVRGGFATADEAVKGWETANAGRIATDQRIAAENAARWAAADEAAFQAILASGRLCERWSEIILLNKNAISRLINDCDVYDRRILDAAQIRRVDPVLISKITRRQTGMMEAEQMRRQQEERDARAWEAAHPKPNWAAWGDAAIKSMQSSGDAYMRQSRQTYTQNLEAWTRGAQNWGGPK